MFAAGLITFRETLEAAFVVGILLSFITKTDQHYFKKYIWAGVAAGVVFAIVLSFLLDMLFGGFSGKTEEIFEGILMFVTAGFLTWMILWVHRQKGIVMELKKKAEKHIEQKFPLGLFFLTLTAVMREGVETVLYLRAATHLGGQGQLTGGAVGVFIAIILGYIFFRGTLKLNLVRLLNISGILLLLFAAGLVAHGVHEFQEAGLLPIFSFDPLINISSFLDNSSPLGSMLRILFGYTAKPTLLEVLSYGMYVLMIFILERMTTKAIATKYTRLQSPKK